MAKPRNLPLDYLTYVGVRLFTMFVHMFSIKTNYVTARVMADLLYRFDRRHRKLALEHLRLSFPDWPEKEVQRVARASMRSMLYLVFDTLFTPRLITPIRWHHYTTLTDQKENLRMLIERKRGMVCITGHFGNWERLGYTMAILGFEGYAVARPLDNPYLNEYILGIRQRNGMTILDKKGASQQMDEILEAKRYVGFIADQDAGKKGLFVDFFGRPASTYKAPALVAMQHEVPVVIGYGRRMDEEFGLEIGIERIIQPEEWAGREDPLRWLTQEYTHALENIARRTPEQYFWVHRRWKHQPKAKLAEKPDVM